MTPSPLKISVAIQLFLSTKKVDAGLAKNSTASYESDLTQFATALSEMHPGPELHPGSELRPSSTDAEISAITTEDLEQFLTHKKKSGMKPASLARKISSLRQFFKFCVIELGLENNPAENLRANQAPRRLPKVLSPEKIEGLLQATEQGLEYTGMKRAESLKARDRAMLILLYATGLRVSELVNLKPENIDWDLNYLKVLGKGGKERLVPFVDAAREKMIEYRETHRPDLIPPARRNPDGSEKSGIPFFLTEAGTALTRQGFWKMLKHMGLKAGIEEPLSPHWIRHSFATHLLHAGLGLRTLQTLLGHSDVSTTQIYTEMSPGHLKEVHVKYHPRGEGD